MKTTFLWFVFLTVVGILPLVFFGKKPAEAETDAKATEARNYYDSITWKDVIRSRPDYMGYYLYVKPLRNQSGIYVIQRRASKYQNSEDEPEV